MLQSNTNIEYLRYISTHFIGYGSFALEVTWVTVSGPLSAISNVVTPDGKATDSASVLFDYLETINIFTKLP